MLSGPDIIKHIDEILSIVISRSHHYMPVVAYSTGHYEKYNGGQWACQWNYHRGIVPTDFTRQWPAKRDKMQHLKASRRVLRRSDYELPGQQAVCRPTRCRLSGLKYAAISKTSSKSRNINERKLDLICKYNANYITEFEISIGEIVPHYEVK